MGINVIISLVILWVGTVIHYLWNNRLKDRWEHGFDQGMRVKSVESRLDRKLDALLEGIGGVQSVNLSAKRYVELLKAEEELIELKLALKEIGGKDDAKV